MSDDFEHDVRRRISAQEVDGDSFLVRQRSEEILHGDFATDLCGEADGVRVERGAPSSAGATGCGPGSRFTAAEPAAVARALLGAEESLPWAVERVP